MLDVIYTYKKTTSDELDWSIKSLRNIAHRNVYVIGDDPKIEGVTHIAPDKQRWGRYSKYHDQIQNYLTACNDWRISEDFIAMNDDFYVLVPWEPINYNRGSLERHVKQRKKRDQYTLSLEQTNVYLENRNLPTLSFELHTPFVFNKQLLKKLIESLDLNVRQILQIRSLYGNTYRIPTEYHTDVKNVKGYGIISTDNRTWRGDLGEYIKGRLA